MSMDECKQDSSLHLRLQARSRPLVYNIEFKQTQGSTLMTLSSKPSAWAKSDWVKLA